MAAGLAGTRSSGLRAQLCGDGHVLNFGAFASPERRLTFDETLPGPFEWDVKRLVATMAVAGHDNGLGTRKRRVVAVATDFYFRQLRHRGMTVRKDCFVRATSPVRSSAGDAQG